MDLLDYPVMGNPLQTWLLALAAAVAAVALLVLVNSVIIKRFKRFATGTATYTDDIVVEVLEATRVWFLAALAIWTGSLVLLLPAAVDELVVEGIGVAVILQIGLWAAAAVRGWVASYSKRKIDADPASVTTIRALGMITRLALWVIIVLAVLANLGMEITPLLGAAGVGGIALALAVQSVLGDLFASLSIVLDKPFVVGDFVIVGDLMGTVEHIGLKTTRVRSLSGEQLVFSNSDLLSSRIRNFKRMFERRAVFSFGVTYQTSHAQLERLPAMVREIVEAQEQTRFDRAHFARYGDSSLDFEVVYYVLVPDYNAYMDIQQAINLELFRRAEAEGIDFAYPTRTLHVYGAEPLAGPAGARAPAGA